MPLLFEQQPGETAKAFEAFSVYLSLGPKRSMAEVGRKLNKCDGLIERWSSLWKWKDRLLAYSTHLSALERQAMEAEARVSASEWRKRQAELRQTEWDLHRRCIEAVRQGLEAYMAKKTVYANLCDIARLLELASKLGRLASGMATDKTEVTGEDGGPIRIELSAALNKIYGEEPAGTVVDVETLPAVPALPEKSE
jgi:hypothetical protein